MRRLTFTSALLAVLAVPTGAVAQASPFTIAVEGVVNGAEGDVIQVAQQAVDPSLVGATCTVTSNTENNSSVHPGNALIITTGDATGTIPEVEANPGATLTLSGSVVLGEDVTVSLQFGPDGLSSGGVTLTFDCAPGEPAPVGGVATGAGGTAGGDGSWVLLGVGGAAFAGAAALIVWRRQSYAR